MVRSQPREVNATEWAAVLCFEPAPALPPDTCLADFDEEDGTLVERFARLLVEPGGGNPTKPLRDLPLHALLAQELHQCVVESKVANFSWFVLLHLQGRAASEGRHAGLIHTPATPLASKLAAEHLLATLGFYQEGLHGSGGLRHEPLLPEDFLIERRREMRISNAERLKDDELSNMYDIIIIIIIIVIIIIIISHKMPRRLYANAKFRL
eukprot:s2552_g5.t1